VSSHSPIKFWQLVPNFFDEKKDIINILLTNPVIMPLFWQRECREWKLKYLRIGLWYQWNINLLLFLIIVVSRKLVLSSPISIVNCKRGWCALNLSTMLSIAILELLLKCRLHIWSPERNGTSIDVDLMYHFSLGIKTII